MKNGSRSVRSAGSYVHIFIPLRLFVSVCVCPVRASVYLSYYLLCVCVCVWRTYRKQKNRICPAHAVCKNDRMLVYLGDDTQTHHIILFRPRSTIRPLLCCEHGGVAQSRDCPGLLSAYAERTKKVYGTRANAFILATCLVCAAPYNLSFAKKELALHYY